MPGRGSTLKGVSLPGPRLLRAAKAAPTAAPAWSIGLTALVGAWLGHFLEYVRVAGWHVGMAEMSSSAHAYFFPAGAALTGVLAGGFLVARRVWVGLGERMGRAQAGLWRRPSTLPARPGRGRLRPVSVSRLWLTLALLQGCTYLLQENLEAVGAGRSAPLLGVLSGVHWLAPVVQAEVALILAVAYSIVHRWFVDRRTRVAVLERLVTRRWARACVGVPTLYQADGAAGTPLERWGAQRWQRPPPVPAAA